MAANISQVVIDGKVITEAMFAGKPAWHGMGTVFDPGTENAPYSEQAIELSHMGWRTEKEPIMLADGRIVPNYFALVRQDTREALSVVGNEYQVLQNTEAFSFLDSLQQDGVIRYESCFALKGGRGIVLLARMPSVDYVTDEDMSLRYALFSAWHGGGAIQITPTWKRVVCENTLRVALDSARGSRSSLSIRHSGDLQQKLSVARNYLAQFDQAFTGYREDAQRLLVGYTAAQAAKYINELFPQPADTAGARAKNNRERKVEQIRRAFMSPAQRLSTVKGTWWALFNSVTEVIDHGRPTRESTNIIEARENRFLSVTEGAGADFKDRALQLALDMSTAA